MNDARSLAARLKLHSPVAALVVIAGVFILLKLVRPIIPHSVVLLYMGFVIVGVIIHITLDDERIRRFWEFFIRRDGEGLGLRVQRWGLLAVIPLVLGWWAYDITRPKYSPPVEIFQRHPTVAEEILNRIVVPAWAADPAKWSPQTVAEGKRLYRSNCAVCHGENLDGNGPAAAGFRHPIRPANFRDVGTIAQLTLPYVYWRLTSGGIQNQFNSAMPRWVTPAESAEVSSLHSYDFTPEEAWKVIVYMYQETGSEPRKEQSDRTGQKGM